MANRIAVTFTGSKADLIQHLEERITMLHQQGDTAKTQKKRLEVRSEARGLAHAVWVIKSWKQVEDASH